MSLPEDFEWRGCASAYVEPISEEEEQTAVCLVNQVQNSNLGFNIDFRLGLGDYDRLHHVFRWTREPIEQVFRDGFRARNVQNTQDNLYFDLEHYVNRAGRPLDPNRPNSFVFISTTADSGWQPVVDRSADVVYRYEIYAPGGIFVAETLGSAYRFPGQAEVAFVDGIAPQYIRSAQRFRPDPRASDSRYPPRLQRVDRQLLINGNFRPSGDTLLQIRNPVTNWIDTEGGRRRAVALNQVVCNFNPSSRGKRQVSTDNALDWYSTLAADTKWWISAAFSSSYSGEVYIFMGNEYVLIKYSAGSAGEKVINGPLSIYDGFPSLAGHFFAEWGIDCAFRSLNGAEAFIFCGNLCALINFAPHTTNDKILKGPITIAQMFPFFEGTVFEKGIDAAFESSNKDEAYLFKGNQCTRINYSSESAKLYYISNIAQGFPSLRGTIFEGGIDAAFASYVSDNAYLFKGDSYANINYAPGTRNDYLHGGVKNILLNWLSLQDILPRKNLCVDVQVHPLTSQASHDEL